MAFLRSYLWALALATLASSQEDDRPYKPTVDSLLMQGTGCPIGAGGIVSGMENGIPIFKFSEWNLDLADLDDATDPKTGKPADAIDKFCIEQIKLGNNPPGYQVRIGKVTVGGKAMLEKGSVLGILVETRLSEEPAGEGELYIEPADLKDGSFKAGVEIKPEVWSSCVGEDGKVPDIHIVTTLALFREGSTTSKGTLGSSDGNMDNAVSVHFDSVWRKCE